MKKKNGIWYCIEFVANDKSIVVMADGYPYAKFAAIRLKNWLKLFRFDIIKKKFTHLGGKACI